MENTTQERSRRSYRGPFTHARRQKKPLIIYISKAYDHRYANSSRTCSEKSVENGTSEGRDSQLQIGTYCHSAGVSRKWRFSIASEGKIFIIRLLLLIIIYLDLDYSHVAVV